MDVPAAQPLTIATGLHNEITEFIIEAKRYLSEDDPRYLNWLDQTQALAKVDAGVAACLRAYAAQAVGAIAVVEENVALARKLGTSDALIGPVQVTTYTNLSYGTKALIAFRSKVDIKLGNAIHGITHGVACGAFQRVEELIEQLKRAEVDLSQFTELPKWQAAREALRFQNVSDEDCAKVVDAAGEVMRSRRLFWLDLQPRIAVHGKQDAVGLKLRVDVSPSDAATMSLELADALVDRNLAEIPFFVTFVGAKK